MSGYLLGIDIGTSACKVAIFDREGHVHASASHKYKVYYPHKGWAEQDPDEWWQAVCIAIKEMISESGISPSDIIGIGVDGQSWSAIPVDQSGNALCNTPIWMDTRAIDICNEVNERVGRDKIYELAGNSLQPSYTTPKVLWYKKINPDMYKKIYAILQSNGYIVYKLTGKISQDMSQTYGWHCIDMRKGIWDYDMADELDIPHHFLPEIVPCHHIVGTVSDKAASEAGLISGIPVVAGGLDACCGTLGAGVIEEGQTQEQGGQAGGMSICLSKYRSDPRLILSYHVIPDKWLLQGGTVGGGGVMKWMEEQIGDYEREIADRVGISSLDQLNQEASKVPVGSDGLIFLPYMAGERSPIWDPDAKGVWYGLDYTKTKAHLIRSSMEGVAFSLRHNLEVAQSCGAYVSELRAMGGSANSLLWTQIKSDITGKTIVVPTSDTATTLGAVILAGVGIGMYDSFKEAVDITVKETRRHEPDSSNKDIYDRNYRQYIKLYENLKDMMDKET